MLNPPVGILPYKTRKNDVLRQNHPNPFQGSTSIVYSIAEPAYVTLAIYDEQGKKVSTLVNEKQNINTYIINFEPLSLKPGCYFYKLCLNGKKEETKKMTIIK